MDSPVRPILPDDSIWPPGFLNGNLLVRQQSSSESKRSLRLHGARTLISLLNHQLPTRRGRIEPKRSAGWFRAFSAYS